MSETHRVFIEKLIPGGEGLGRLGDGLAGSPGGRAVFVPYVIPDETVLVEITESRKDYCRGRAIEILDPSPSRRKPPCPFFGCCGGCQFQHMSYRRQLEEKEAVLRETLMRIGGIDLSDISVVPSPETAYRIRVRLHRGADTGLGFKQRRSERVIPVDRCCVCVEPINRVIAGAPKISTAEITLLAADAGVVSSRGSDSRQAVITVADRQIRCDPEVFFQSNLDLLPELVAHVTGGLAGSRILDLYCGIGLFGSFLSMSVDQLTSVDRDAAAVALARENVQGTKHRFNTQSVESWVSGRRERCDAVVVDPARPGLAAPVIDYLLSCGARELVYVSCNPVTLARDLARLCRVSPGAGGFTIRDIRLFDFFPQTHHVEMVARLIRGTADR